MLCNHEYDEFPIKTKLRYINELEHCSFKSDTTVQGYQLALIMMKQVII